MCGIIWGQIKQIIKTVLTEPAVCFWLQGCGICRHDLIIHLMIEFEQEMMPVHIQMSTDTWNRHVCMRWLIFFPPPHPKNHPRNREAADEAALFGPLGHTHSWCSTAGSAHASLVRSSNVTSTFSVLYLSNLWHYRPLFLRLLTGGKKRKKCFQSVTLHRALFPRMLKGNIS